MSDDFYLFLNIFNFQIKKGNFEKNLLKLKQTLDSKKETVPLNPQQIFATLEEITTLCKNEANYEMGIKLYI